MSRIGIVCCVSVLSVVVCAGAGGKKPVARIVEVKGTATIVGQENSDRPAAVYGTVYADERLVIGDDSQVMLVFRSGGQVERVAASGTFQVTRNGCEPRKGVEELPALQQHRVPGNNIDRDLSGIVQGGVVTVRRRAHPAALSDRLRNTQLRGPCARGDLPTARFHALGVEAQVLLACCPGSEALHARICTRWEIASGRPRPSRPSWNMPARRR